MERKHTCRRLNECQCVLWITKIVNKHTASDVLMRHIDCDREWADQMVGLCRTPKFSSETDIYIRVCSQYQGFALLADLRKNECDGRLGCVCEYKV